MVSWRTTILLGAASLLVASFACTGADSKPVALTPVPQEQGVPIASKADVTLSTTVPASNSNVGASFSVDDKQEPVGRGSNSAEARRWQGFDRCPTQGHRRPNLCVA